MSADGPPAPSLPRAPALTEANPHLGGTNGLAVTSLVFAIVGCVSGFGSPWAIILGHIALVQIRRYPQGGGGLAFTGLVLGYIGLAFWIVALVSIKISSD